jgi:hypothetical protein
MVHKSKWIATDAWRGYYQPAYAVLGSSDTGTWSDSPCPSDKVNEELKGFQGFLKGNGIHSVIKTGRSSNVFMIKRWVVVSQWDFKKAKKIAGNYLKEKETRYVHEAD